MKSLPTLIIALLLTVHSVAGANEQIRLTNGEWPPYLSEKLPQNGAASHIVTEAFAAVGVDVEYGFFPWKRAYQLAVDGIWHGTLIWVKTPERERDFYYSDVVISDPEYLFYLKSRKLKWKEVKDLKNLNIGATLHTVYPTLEAAEKEGILTIDRSGNYDNLYQRLLHKRIDAIPQVNQVGKYFQRARLSKKDRVQITHSSTVLQLRQYHLILSKNVEENSRFIELFNQGLAILKASGRYYEIISALDTGEYDKK